ncbi:O-antigen ligase [Cryobacterium sp. MP_M3]|uniref:O-antigen ligase family protein n=1 Tax=unclassified Cryobacterium TaxID=2649013 RepID=UPI0018CA69A1|nr:MULTISPECIES: O-antigen ligase family protein [unclassified Cryobacterium]MBG6057007.1 O-antigen ligase [Cryobacterium sp. MP_M3]
MRLAVSAVANLAQGFLPPFTNSLSAGLLWTLAMAPKTVMDCWRQLRHPVAVMVSFILAFQLVAGLWSEDLSIWRIRVLQTFAFWVVVLLAFELQSRGRSVMQIVLASSTPLVVFQSAAVVLFRVFPNREAAYLHSDWAGSLIGSAVRGLYSGDPNNVLDPAKSGGLLNANANVASMLLGMYLMGYLWWWLTSGSHLALAMAVLTGLSVPFTGSKTGLILLAGLGLFVGLSWLLASRKKIWIFLVSMIVVLGGGAIGASVFLDRDVSGISAQTDTSWGTRLTLWGAAGRYFATNPVFGLGFGGWESRMRATRGELGITEVLPPHNFLIAMWAESGVTSVLVVVALFAVFLVWGITGVRSSVSGKAAVGAAALIGIVAWAFFHGMADNTTFFGTTQTAALFAAALAVVSPPGAGPFGRARGGVRDDEPRSGP